MIDVRYANVLYRYGLSIVSLGTLNNGFVRMAIYALDSNPYKASIQNQLNVE